ncbi:MAG: hypothetical protein IT230_04270 [Flavobacteriales bacterium]|nr:hypothetical protein [Flavobacteriales bacterium]
MKLLSAPACALLCASLSAQTIQYTDLGPFGGEADMHYLADLAGFPVLAAGTGQTWDLSGLALLAAGTMQFQPAAGTPYATTYPAANWTWVHQITGLATTYNYLNITTTGIELLARNVPAATVDYSDPERVMQFPLPFGASFTDAYQHDGGSGSATWTFAGTGTLITPNTTITDAALLTCDNGDAAIWNRSPLYPVMIKDDNDAMFYTQTNVGVAEHAGNPLKVWPNPCQGLLYAAHGTAAVPWQVQDAVGRIACSGTLDPSGLIEVQALAPGAYVLTVGHAPPVRFVKE